MFKQLSICAVLIAFGTGSVNAQQQEAVLQRIAVPGAGFDIVVAMPKHSGATYNLGNLPEAPLIHLIGGELALGFDGEEKMLKALDSLQLPVCAFHVESKIANSRKPSLSTSCQEANSVTARITICESQPAKSA